jgi:hypothetical protein
VTPDRCKTVLRSRLGLKYGQLPASELAARACLLPKSSAYRISGVAEWDLAAETLFFNRRLSFRRLLWVDLVTWRLAAHDRCSIHHLFTAQSDDWIDLRSATSRQPASQQQDDNHYTGNDRQDEGVVSAQPV